MEKLNALRYLVFIFEDKQEETLRAHGAVRAAGMSPYGNDYHDLKRASQVLGHTLHTHVDPRLCRDPYIIGDNGDDIHIDGLKGEFRIGVITDIMMPLEEGEEEIPAGLSVVMECLKRRIPCVVCSSKQHASPLLGPLFQMGRQHVPWNEQKNWTKAAQTLKKILDGGTVSPEDIE